MKKDVDFSDEAHKAIRQALEEKNARQLPVDEALEWINTPRMQFIVKKKGRRPELPWMDYVNKNTYLRRRKILYRLIGIQESRKKAAKTHRKFGEITLEFICRIAIDIVSENPQIKLGRLRTLATEEAHRKKSVITRRHVSRIIDGKTFTIIKNRNHIS